MNEQEAKDFLDKVAEMRDAQQEFFKHREKGIMKMAMHLEKEVDQMIVKYRLKRANYGTQSN
jgi:hypothetical protein